MEVVGVLLLLVINAFVGAAIMCLLANDRREILDWLGSVPSNNRLVRRLVQFTVLSLWFILIPYLWVQYKRGRR